jgi:hypothetical protein
MYERWVGAALILVSVFVAGIAGSNVKVLYQKQDWAQTENGKQLVEDATVSVPPWNSTSGWVGFNITLPHQKETDYGAYGAIEPADQNTNPDMEMAAVNATGLSLLTFDGFSPAAWNASQVYTSSFLNSTYLTNTFWFRYLDNSSYYVLLFRGLENGTQNLPVLISIQELWFEPGPVLVLVPWSASIVAAVAFLGLGLIVYDLNSQRARSRLKRLKRIKRSDDNKKRAKG